MSDSGNLELKFLENYIDCVENLPDDLQKQVSRILELDVNHQRLVRKMEEMSKQYEKNHDKFDIIEMQSVLIEAQEVGDEKLEIIQLIQDLLEAKIRSLDSDYKRIEDSSKERDATTSASTSTINNPFIGGNDNTSHKEHIPTSTPTTSNGNGEQRQSKRVRRVREEPNSSADYGSSSQHHSGEHNASIPVPRASATLMVSNQKKRLDNSVASSRKKKRKSNTKGHKIQKNDDDSHNSRSLNDEDEDDDDQFDPDEPTYCLCVRVSYGEMIGCDNDLCPIEWFHFKCVSLTNKPKGKWFCPMCRGDRPNVMKPKSQFLKDLERYNRNKEEQGRFN